MIAPKCWGSYRHPNLHKPNLRTALSEWLSHNGLLDATLGDILGEKTIIPSTRPVLAASLPYQIIEKVETVSVLPETFRHQYRLVLFENAVKRSQNQPLFEFNSSFPNLANQKMSLSFVPATAEDEVLIQEYSQLTGRFSRINLNAILRVGETEIARAGPFLIGTELVLETIYTTFGKRIFTQLSNCRRTSGFWLELARWSKFTSY